MLAGPAGDPGIRTMHAAINRRFLPNLVLALHPTGTEASEIEALVPFLKEQRSINGKGTAYICENYACNLPTTDVRVMTSFLDGEGR